MIVSGYIVDVDGEPFYNFNGSMKVKVFDRIDTITTLANDPQSYITDFLLRDSVLLIVEAEVLNGHFSFAFQLPYELDEVYGNIKLSYYGMDYPLDARGQFSELVVGGPPSKIPENIALDAKIQLFPTLINTNINIVAKQNINELQLNIFDLTGRKIHTYSVQNIQAGHKSSLDLSHLILGMYIVRVNADNQMSNVKIIKN